MDPASPSNTPGIYIQIGWVYSNPFTPEMIREMGAFGPSIADGEYVRQRDEAIKTYREQIKYFIERLNECGVKHGELGPGNRRIVWAFQLMPVARTVANDPRLETNPESYAERLPGGNRTIKILIGPVSGGGQADYARRIALISSGSDAMTMAHELAHLGAYCAAQGRGGSHHDERYIVMADGRWSIVDATRNYVDKEWIMAIKRLIR